MKSEDTIKQETNTLLLQLQKENAAIESISPPSQPKPKPPVLFSKRFFVALLLFFGNVSVQLVSQVINIAVIEMKSNKQTSWTSSSDTWSNSFVVFLLESPQIQWNTMTFSMILNMFWCGFLFAPIGGILTHKFGGARTMGVSTLLASIAVLLSPFSLRIHLYFFMACRGLVGLFMGFNVASCTQIFAHWIPKRERSTFVSYIVNGYYFGNAVTFILCGFLAHHWGWSMAFYGAGIFCFVWSLLWLFFVANDPAEDKNISEDELAYIKKETANISATMNNDQPFKAIFSSAPFWAMALCKFAYGWGQTFSITYYPTYVKDAIDKNTDVIGYLSSVPNLANIVALPMAGLLLSYVQKRIKLGDNLIHKSILCIGFVICSTLFALITIWNSFIVSMTCVVIINVLISYNKIIYELVTINIAPNHTGLVSGLSLFVYTIGSIIPQIFVGYLVEHHVSKVLRKGSSLNLQEWSMCFVWSSGVFLLISFVYLIFGSSEAQPWSVHSPHEIIPEFKILSIQESENNKHLLK